MRTKTAVLTAALVAAGALSSMAQNVYSVNVVGYVNVTVPANKFAILANPLNATNTSIGTVLAPAGIPDGTTVYKWTGSTYNISQKGQDDNGFPAWDVDFPLAPGTGFWVKNVTASPMTITFVGEVPQGSLSNGVPAGFSIVGSQVPQSGDLASVLNYPAFADPNGITSTAVYRWNSAASTYTISTYGFDDNNVPAWDVACVPAVAEGYWVKEAAPRAWTRTFTVQ